MPFNLTMSGTSAYPTTGQKFGAGDLSTGYGLLAAGATLGVDSAAGTWSLSAMVKVSNPTRLGVAVQLTPTIYLAVDAAGLANFCASTASATATVAIADGQWHELEMCGSAAGSTLCFVDGVLVTTLTRVSAQIKAASFAIGTYAVGGAKSASLDWEGQIDDVGVFNTQRYTASHATRAAAFNGDEAGLVALYRLDGNGTDSLGVPISNPSPPAIIDRLNSAIFYSPMNWKDDGTSTNTNNTGAYSKTRFTGTSFAVSIVALVGLTNYPVVRAYIDNRPPVDVAITSGATVLTFATALAAGTHKVRLSVLRLDESGSGWTLANAVKITGLVLDNGATVSAPTLRSKRAALFGDSIPSGGGALGAAYGGNASDLTYVPSLMQALDCEYGNICYGGQGFAKAGTDTSVPAFNTAYAFYSSGKSRLLGGVFDTSLDYVFCTHGTNPLASGGTLTQSEVATGIANLRAAAPNAVIFFFVPPGGFGRTQIRAAVNAAIAAGDLKLVLIDAGSEYEDGLSGFAGGASSKSVDGVHPYATPTHTALAGVYTGQVQRALEPGRAKIIVA